MPAAQHKYKPGDRVVNERDRDRPGKMVKPARTYHLVRFDGDDDDERVRDDDIRPETAQDVAKREHGKRMQAWNDRRPQTILVRVAISSSWYSRDPVGTEIIGPLKTPADMRSAAAELQLLAGWFEQRPAEPSKDTE